MPYRRISFYQDGCYHIYNRGNHKKDIFHDKGDYFYFLKKLKIYSSKYQIKIIAYCLMPNHFHLLIQQQSEHPVSEFMKELLRDYVEFYNYKYKTVGRLFQGPFKARIILSEAYLIHLTRYIHLNPLDIGVCAKNLAQYPWSSYLEFIGARQGSLPKFRNVISQIDDYRQYVLEGAGFRIKNNLKILAIDYRP